MFKKTLNLITNELIKQFKKVSTKIFLALILVLAIAMPFAVKSFESREYNFWTQNNKNELSNIESEISRIEKEIGAKKELGLIFRGIDKEVVSTKIEGNISYDWRNESLEEYRQLRYEEEAMKAVVNKYKKKDIQETAYMIEPIKIEDYFYQSKEKLNKEIKKVSDKAKLTKEMVVKNDYLMNVSNKIKTRQDNIKEFDKQIKELEKTLKKNPKNKEIPAKILELKESIEQENKYIELDKFRLDNKVPYDDKDYRHRTLQSMEFALGTLNGKMVTEEEFLKNPQQYSHFGKTYDEYKTNFIDEQNRAKKQLDLGWYSVKNNIPMENYTVDSRSMVSNGFEIFVIIAGIVSIILAGSIVSTEFSKGTVRLLLIRPVSRFKILLSKLLAVLIIGFGILVVSISVYIAAVGAAYGFDAFSISSLKYVEGKVVELGYFAYLIPKILTSCVSVLFVTSLAFMLSTIAKNTAVAVGLSSILYLGSVPMSMILGTLKAGFLAQWVIGYMNLSMFNIMEYFPIMMKEQYSVVLDPQTGVIQLLVLTVVFIIGAFISFTKTDIKN
ncbi:MAG: ABC transporter permease subunit [Clostridium sp.]